MPSSAAKSAASGAGSGGISPLKCVCLPPYSKICSPFVYVLNVLIPSPRARDDPILAGPDPLAADLDHLAATDRVVERPPADPVARLEHDDRMTGADKLSRRGQPREPGADDHDVHAPARAGPGARPRRLARQHGPGRRGSRADRAPRAARRHSSARHLAAAPLAVERGTGDPRSPRSARTGSRRCRPRAPRRLAAAPSATRRARPTARAPGTATCAPAYARYSGRSWPGRTCRRRRSGSHGRAPALEDRALAVERCVGRLPTRNGLTA